MRSGDITVTDGRLNKLLNDKIVDATQDSTLNSIDERVNETRLQGGILKKFYAYQDRAEVKLDNGKTVSCEILHKFGPDLVDLYTPLGEVYFDDTINERYIVPWGEMYCIVSSFRWKDKEKYVLMGYWLNDDLVGANPSSPGDFKIITRGGSIQYKLAFGLDGLEVITNESSTTYRDDFNPDYVPDYVDREEVYTKSEVDELIEERGGAPAHHTHTVSDITDIDTYTSTEIKMGYILLKNGIRANGGLS